MALNIKHFKEKLEKEKKRLEDELGEIAKKNPKNNADWEAVPENMNLLNADKNEMADFYEEFENRQAVEIELENRLNDVLDALKRIKKGIYGICETSGNPIDEKRLEANPAARTCVTHSK